jgi:hypothetical protein
MASKIPGVAHKVAVADVDWAFPIGVEHPCGLGGREVLVELRLDGRREPGGGRKCSQGL